MKWIGPIIYKVLEAIFGSAVFKWTTIVLGGIIAVGAAIYGISCLVAYISDNHSSDTNFSSTDNRDEPPLRGNPNTCQTPEVIYL